MKSIKFFAFQTFGICVMSMSIFFGVYGRADISNCSQIYENNKLDRLSNALTKKVLNLSDDQEIPISVYESYPIDDIARAVVMRIRDQELQYQKFFTPIKHKAVNLLSDTDLILFFWDKNLKLIGEVGFLNQYQTGTSSGGRPNWNVRSVMEDRIAGLRLGLSQPALKLRAKSAFLNIRSDIELTEKNNNITDRYGNIGAVLKPEVRNRALWTASDSLWLGGSGRFGVNIDYSPQSLAAHRGTFSRDTLSCEKGCGSYYEALIYGNLKVEHVDYFLVVDPKLSDSLKQFGKPIYLAQTSTFHKRVIFKKGKLLFAGNSFPI